MPPSPVTGARDGTSSFGHFNRGGLRAGGALRMAPAVARSDGTGRAGRATRPAATTPDRVLTPAGHKPTR
jgi:hypothetical protein